MANSITVVGNVWKIKRWENDGNPSLSVTITDSSKNQDGSYNNMTFVASIYGKDVERVQNNFVKGMPCVLSGSISAIKRRVDDNDDEYIEAFIRYGARIDFIPKDKSDRDGGANGPKKNSSKGKRHDPEQDMQDDGPPLNDAAEDMDMD